MRLEFALYRSPVFDNPRVPAAPDLRAPNASLPGTRRSRRSGRPTVRCRRKIREAGCGRPPAVAIVGVCRDFFPESDRPAVMRALSPRLAVDPQDPLAISPNLRRSAISRRAAVARVFVGAGARCCREALIEKTLILQPQIGCLLSFSTDPRAMSDPRPVGTNMPRGLAKRRLATSILGRSVLLLAMMVTAVWTLLALTRKCLRTPAHMHGPSEGGP
jgi:hypothetical protein